MKSLMTQLVLSITSALLVLYGYHHTVIRPIAHIGVVDIAGVYRRKETAFTERVTKAASEGERQAALQVARQFAQRLPIALDELSQECNCLVLIRAAVASVPHNAIDLTELLENKVDLP